MKSDPRREKVSISAYQPGRAHPPYERLLARLSIPFGERREEFEKLAGKSRLQSGERDVLHEALSWEDQPKVRSAALRALLRHPKRDVVQTLSRLLRTGHPKGKGEEFPLIIETLEAIAVADPLAGYSFADPLRKIALAQSIPELSQMVARSCPSRYPVRHAVGLIVSLLPEVVEAAMTGGRQGRGNLQVGTDALYRQRVPGVVPEKFLGSTTAEILGNLHELVGRQVLSLRQRRAVQELIGDSTGDEQVLVAAIKLFEKHPAEGDEVERIAALTGPPASLRVQNAAKGIVLASAHRSA